MCISSFVPVGLSEAETRLRQSPSASSSVSAAPPAQETLLRPSHLRSVGPEAEPVTTTPQDATRTGRETAGRSTVPPPAAAPAPAPRTETAPPAPAPAPSGDLDTAWQRVVDDVMKKKPMLGAVLMHARPNALKDGELSVILTGNHFHRETLAETANREMVRQAVKRHVAGAEQFNVVTETNGGGAITDDPVVRAAIAEFQGEVVAVRRRAPEGEGQ